MAPITSLMSARSGCSGWRRAKASSRRVRSAPRSADSSASRTSSSVTGSSGADLAQHVEIADDDRQQVVEVVRQTAGELADRLHLLRLTQLVALRLRLAPFGQVAHDADEGMVAGLRRFADRELHREGRAILAPPHDLAADADDLRHAGREIGRDVAVVFAVIGLRHQDAHVLPDDFVRCVAEQADAGLVERLDDAVCGRW